MIKKTNIRVWDFAEAPSPANVGKALRFIKNYGLAIQGTPCQLRVEAVGAPDAFGFRIELCAIEF